MGLNPEQTDIRMLYISRILGSLPPYPHILLLTNNKAKEATFTASELSSYSSKSFLLVFKISTHIILNMSVD